MEQKGKQHEQQAARGGNAMPLLLPGSRRCQGLGVPQSQEGKNVRSICVCWCVYVGVG